MRYFLIFLLGISFPSFIPAQNGRPYTSGQEEYFAQGHLPDMRAEAMGKAQVALGGDIILNYTNPASIGEIKFRSVSFSSSGPFYILKESDYAYLGMAQRIQDTKWVGGVSVRGFFIGPSTFDATIEGNKYELDKARVVNTTLSVAREVLPGLQVGVNANLYRLRLFSDADGASMPHFDLGALYHRELGNRNHLRVGLSFNNFLFGRIAYKAPNGDEDVFNMPAVLRIGGSYNGERRINIPQAGEGPLRYLITVEVQDFVNSEFYTALRFGGEVEIWDLLALRIGAFRMNKDDGGFAVNFTTVRDFTYGFGFILPLEKITKKEWPVRMHLDYTSLRQALTSNFSGKRTPNMRGLSVRLVWLVAANN